MSGVPMEDRIRMMTTTRLTRAILFCLKRLHAAPQYPTLRAPVRPAAVTVPSAMIFPPLLQPDPGIKKRIHQIHNEVEDHHGQRQDKRRGDDERIVPEPGRVDEELADSRNPELVLNIHGRACQD